MRIACGPSLEIYNAPAFQSSKDGCICRLIEAGTLIGYRCACHPAPEGKRQALANQLSNSEKAVCARIGINESEYLAQKSAAGPLTVQINPALRDERRAGHRAAMQSLPAPEREIAVAMNTDPRDYSARRAWRRWAASHRELTDGRSSKRHASNTATPSTTKARTPRTWWLRRARRSKFSMSQMRRAGGSSRSLRRASRAHSNATRLPTRIANRTARRKRRGAAAPGSSCS